MDLSSLAPSYLPPVSPLSSLFYTSFLTSFSPSSRGIAEEEAPLLLTPSLRWLARPFLDGRTDGETVTYKKSTLLSPTLLLLSGREREDTGGERERERGKVMT